jgi:ATP-binding cassette subfamily B protein/subfamily B ATP-binding cassette protein MsbA
MAFDRTSSRSRFATYNRRRREDRAWARVSPEDKGPRADKMKRSRSFGALFRAYWSHTRGHRRAIALALTTLTLTTGLGLALPAGSKFAIDFAMLETPGLAGIPAQVRDALGIDLPGVDAPGLNTPTPSTATPSAATPGAATINARARFLWIIGLSMMAITLVAVMLGTIGRWQATRVTKRIQAELRTRAFNHAARLPLHRIQQFKSGGMASVLREDAGLAGELFFSMIYNPWRAMVQLVGTLAILSWVDWRMLVGGLMLLPIVWITHATWISRLRPLYRDSKLVRQGIDATTVEAFSGMRVVRGFGRERAEAARFTSAQHYMTRIEVLTWWWSRAVEIAWAVMIPAATAAVLIYGGLSVIDGGLTVGDVMMFMTYLLMLLGPLETLTSTATNIQSNLAAMDRVQDLLAEPREFAPGQDAPEQVAPEQDAPATGGIRVDRANTAGAIALRGVSFAYPARSGTAKDRAKAGGAVADSADARGTDASASAPASPPTPVLSNITIDVRAGETIALVGASGSGKTTLCNLIARFHDPVAGSIHLDGRNLRDIDVDSYRRLLGIVEQDVFLFDGSVRENIAYARRDASEAQIRAAADAAYAHEFIVRLERGYDTLIGERGVKLSGGQKQRLAIARAILADPVILILDEATSNLDTESERLIQASLTRLMRGRTSFVIAHRLSTIRTADRILVLERGQVIEFGTHDELLRRGGRYAFLLQLQTGDQPGGDVSHNAHP